VHRDEILGAWLAEKDRARKHALLSRVLVEFEPLIKKFAFRTVRQERTPIDSEDALQAARIGFVTALERFDPRRGRISTYAANWIRHEVQQATRSSKTIRLPRIRMTNEERKAALDKVRANPEATADELGLSQTKVDQLKYSIGLRYTSTATEEGAYIPDPLISHDEIEERIDAKREIAALGGEEAALAKVDSAAPFGFADPDPADVAAGIVRCLAIRPDGSHCRREGRMHFSGRRIWMCPHRREPKPPTPVEDEDIEMQIPAEPKPTKPTKTIPTNGITSRPIDLGLDVPPPPMRKARSTAHRSPRASEARTALLEALFS
jgi:RNA polymerase sigma factor (sigma-70 family)